MEYDYIVIEEITNDENYLVDLMGYEPVKADESCNVEIIMAEDLDEEMMMPSCFDTYDSCIDNYYDEDNSQDD